MNARPTPPGATSPALNQYGRIRGQADHSHQGTILHPLPIQGFPHMGQIAGRALPAQPHHSRGIEQIIDPLHPTTQHRITLIDQIRTIIQARHPILDPLSQLLRNLSRPRQRPQPIRHLTLNILHQRQRSSSHRHTRAKPSTTRTTLPRRTHLLLQLQQQRLLHPHARPLALNLDNLRRPIQQLITEPPRTTTLQLLLLTQLNCFHILPIQ